MDFKFCYEDGYKNHRKELSETDKAYMAGYEKAYQEIESFMANTDCYEQKFKTAESKEIRAEIINNLRDWLRMEWYEIIVSMIDEADDGVQKENDEYAIPDPLSEEDVSEMDFDD